MTTTIPGSYSPERAKVIEELKRREKEKSGQAPSEFKLFDDRIEYKVEEKDEFDNESEIDQVHEETKQGDIKDEEPEAIKPDQFQISDDRYDYKVADQESDRFSETEVSVAESSQAEGLFEYAKKFDGDQALNAEPEPEVRTVQTKTEDKAVQARDLQMTVEELKQIEAKAKIQLMVDATISAWSSNPSMVKKQLDQQNDIIKNYKTKIQDLEYKLSLKGKELEKEAGITSIRTLEHKKKELERQNVILLEREKKRIVETRLKEMHELKKENKELEMETRRLKLLLKKYKK